MRPRTISNMKMDHLWRIYAIRELLVIDDAGSLYSVTYRRVRNKDAIRRLIV